jgi:hypothetical protein
MIAREMNLLLDILTDLLVPVAITGDGPPLPHTPITQLDSIGFSSWYRFAGAESKRKRLRGAN